VARSGVQELRMATTSQAAATRPSCRERELAQLQAPPAIPPTTPIDVAARRGWNASASRCLSHGHFHDLAGQKGRAGGMTGPEAHVDRLAPEWPSVAENLCAPIASLGWSYWPSKCRI
jgi:hypothetical protein